MKRITAAVLAVALLAGGSYARAQEGEGESPVVRAQAGNWGFMFVFGGLATMISNNFNSWNDNARHTVNVQNYNSLYSEFGVKYMFTDPLAFYLTFGVGMVHYAPEADNQDDQTSWGLTATAGVEYHFRVWRRISPYIGASMSFGGLDPTGKENGQFLWGVGLPHVGIEYFWGDRASLAAEYTLQLALIRQMDPAQAAEWTGFGFGTLLSHGGNMRLTFYF